MKNQFSLLLICLLLILNVNFQKVLAIGSPSLQASNIVITNITSTSATLSWTNGDGAGRVVFVENPSGTAAAPYNNNSYTASADWNVKGTKIGSSNYYCVYNGSDNSVNLTNLTPNATFAVRISEYNGAAGAEQYLTTIVTGNPKTFTTLASASLPGIQASNILVTNITSTSATISWTNGDGTNRVVFVENPSGTAAAPYQNNTYTASVDWNVKGTKIGSSNYYCVYNGSGSSVDLTNLSPNSRFAIRISEYNGSGGNEQYLTTIGTGNPTSFYTPDSIGGTAAIKMVSDGVASIILYPNPTSGLFKLQTAMENVESMNISITDLQGILIYKFSIPGKSAEFDLSSAASGVYIVRVDINGFIRIYKLIKQ